MLKKLKRSSAMLLLVIGSCSGVPKIDETSIAVKLPEDWEIKTGVSVTDTPTVRSQYFAVHRSYLEECVTHIPVD